VKVEGHTDHVEGESVASSQLEVSPHRLIHVIRGLLQKLDHGLHRFHGLAAGRHWLISVVPGRTRSGQSNCGRPNTFLKLRALRGETKLRSRNPLIFNLDLRKSLISKPGLTQVVDFHVIFRYFSCFFADGENTLGAMALSARPRILRQSVEETEGDAFMGRAGQNFLSLFPNCGKLDKP
jgi:hypothetical protein